jgi:exonuclease VII small subunit
MTQVEAQEVEKKSRRKQLKKQATVAEIIKNFNDLKAEVSKLEESMQHVTEGSKLHQLATKELMSKKKELEDALDTVYYY